MNTEFKHDLYLSFRWDDQEESCEPIVAKIPQTKLEAQGLIDLLVISWFESHGEAIPSFVTDVELTAGRNNWKWDRIEINSH